MWDSSAPPDLAILGAQQCFATFVYSAQWPRSKLFLPLQATYVFESNADGNQGTAFCQTYSQFLACRALFGVAMGGLYGNAAAMALEDVPDEARGLMSGILQQGVGCCATPSSSVSICRARFR